MLHSAAFRRLNGKTQLFPSHESDFFRNRLTHSLEVAQIAKSIAIRINGTELLFMADPIDADLVETASLAHDLGHPPFGHNGEEALDECMRDAGGFEGNAQTLRILSKLEKRQTAHIEDDEPIRVHNGSDRRVGLNLTYRTLAAVLKYDKEIPREGKERGKGSHGAIKGYYYTEADLVRQIKKSVGALPGTRFKTVECAIMDVADDIAYSTYDLEDSFKAGFISPLYMLSAPSRVLGKVAETVAQRLGLYYPEIRKRQRKFDTSDAYRVLLKTFAQVYSSSPEELAEEKSGDLDPVAAAAGIASRVAAVSAKIASDGYFRTKLTSDLVGRYIGGVRVEPNQEYPALSRVRLDIETFKQVEVLKNFAYQSLIMSSMLKVTEHRGKDIVKSIFKTLTCDDGHLLMPDDFRSLHADLKEPDERKRVVCDFIAGMTDRYAIQFYSRLFGTTPESIYSPL